MNHSRTWRLALIGTVVLVSATSCQFFLQLFNQPPQVAISLETDGDPVVGGRLTFSGAGSIDADGNTLTFQWNILVSPQGSSVSMENANETVAFFTPDVSGEYIIELTVSDEVAEISDTITVTVIAGNPDIAVSYDTTNVNSGGNVDFGGAVVGTGGTTTTFTVTNAGTGVLTLTGATSVVLGGSDISDFAVTQPTSTSVAEGASITFSMTFDPQSAGSKSATVSIDNNDADEGSFQFTVSGTATLTPQPEIGLKQGTVAVASGGSFDFGSILAGTFGPATPFAIENSGTLTLFLSGSPLVDVTGTDASAFVVSQPAVSSISAGSNVGFTITFNPLTTGVKSAAFTIVNDDFDEGVYSVSLAGTGSSVPQSDINIQQSGTNVLTSDTFDFGTIPSGQSGGSIVFTLQNLVNTTLVLTGTPAVAISGANPGDFIVNPPVASSIPAGLSTTFSISFAPSATGSRSATIAIASNDPDEGSYTIYLTGSGGAATEPEIAIKEGVTEIASGGTHAFGNVPVGTSATVTLTVENSGTATLNLTGTPVVFVNGADASEFMTTFPAVGIAAAGSSTFDVTFTPASAAAKVAAITVVNTDADEGTYVVNLTGTGVAEPEIDLTSASTSIPNGGSYDFGSVASLATGAQVVFTIENLGAITTTLNLNPTVTLSGTDAGDFTVDVEPVSTAITGGSSTTFNVSFTPGAITGVKNATMTITSDDSDEATYDVSITGVATAGAEPEINLKYNSTDYASGSTIVFGTVAVGTTSPTATLTIENLGSAPLNLTGSPDLVAVGGANAPQVGLIQPALASIPAGGGTTFTIDLTPVSAGAQNATLTIVNDDTDESSYVVNLSATGSAPEINLKQNASNLPSGTSSYDFGSVAEGQSGSSVLFTIENLGDADLALTSSPNVVVVSGANAGDFNITQPLVSTILPLSSATFSVTFAPTGQGTRIATITIASNDIDEAIYTFAVSGTGTGAEIEVTQGASVIDSGTGSYDFGNVAVTTSSAPVTFDISNVGSANLVLSGSPDAVQLSGDIGHFGVTQPSSSTIVGGSFQSFDVIFSPTSAGTKSVTVTVASNDADENPYTFTIDGNGAVAPEIDVNIGGSTIASGSTRDLGSVEVGQSATSVTFTIENLGTGDLILSGTPTIAKTGTEAADFAETQPATTTITAGSSTTFTVTFTPSAVGTRDATLIIASNDGDEGTYVLNLTGSGTLTAEPEINLKQGSTNIASLGEHDFGQIELGLSSAVVTFTIENLGTATLSLTGASEVAGGDIEFVVTQPASSSIAPAGSETFTVTFTPATLGNRQLTLTIANNDADEGTYTFDVEGDGTEAEINLKQGSTSYASGSIYSYPDIQLGNPVEVTFTIENTGSANLQLTGTAPTYVELTGIDASQFSVSAQPATGTVGAPGSVTFKLTFDPTATGDKTAIISVPNSDGDEDPYVISITGKAVSSNWGEMQWGQDVWGP